jgi:hypothetical protein
MATLEQQQQHLINVLAEKPRQFNYDIPVYRTQCITVRHKMTADELQEWAYEEDLCKDLDAIPTAQEWDAWNQAYLDQLQQDDAWGEVDEWNVIEQWHRDEDYSNWELDGEIDTWTDKEGE